MEGMGRRRTLRPMVVCRAFADRALLRHPFHLPSACNTSPDDSKIDCGEQCFDRGQFELPLSLKEFVNGRLGKRGIMRPRQLPESIDSEMETLHLPRHRFPDDALARRQPAAGITLETMKLPTLGDLTGVDGTLHGGMEAVESRLGSRGNIFCRLPHDLTGH